MTRRRYDATRLLKWYPATWRARYGDEFMAYVDDTLNGERPSVGFRLSIALGGVRERGHQSGLIGEQSTRDVQTRAGSLLVLCAWSGFMLAGASFSKLSEHFARAMPTGSSVAARVGFDVVAASGALGMITVLIGSVVALPTVVAFLRSGGWTSIRRPVFAALMFTVLALVALVPLVRWAHDLTVSQRNGGDSAYSLAFVAWATVIALTLASWIRAILQCVSRMNLPARVLRTEARLATALSFLMVTITGGAALWWLDVARHAPWFLQGARFGTMSSPFAPNVVLTLGLMVIAATVGGFGVRRIAHARRLS